MCDWNSCLYTWQSITFLVWNYCIGKANIFFKLLNNFYSWINQVWCDFQFFLSDLRPWLWLYVFLIKFIYRVSHFEMDLTDENMQVRLGLKMVLECWNRKFLGTTTIFQKSSIGWPQQPLTEKVLKFNLIFHDSTPKKYFFKTSK